MKVIVYAFDKLDVWIIVFSVYDIFGNVVLIMLFKVFKNMCEWKKVVENCCLNIPTNYSKCWKLWAKKKKKEFGKGVVY